MTPAHPDEELLEAALERLAAAKTLDITDDESADAAREILVQVQKLRTKAETARKKGKQPWLAGGREVDAHFKPVLDALDKAKGKAKAAMNAYLMKVRTAQREAARREEAQAAETVSLRKAAGAESMSDDGHLTPQLRPEELEAPETPAFSTTRIPTLVLGDESKIPAEFWYIDKTAVRRALAEGRKVGEARIEYIEQIAAR
jgi:hypothetical protein